MKVSVSTASRTLVLVSLLFSFATATTPAQPAKVVFQSSENKTSLLELYTSEGCSSCPPAETRLSRLKESPRLWRDFVPVAFHVDYWDYLGWRDPFAASAYSKRQHAYADLWRSRSVYTPGFVLDGKEWGGWFKSDGPARSANKPAGSLTARSEDGRRWTLRFEPAAQSASAAFDFHAALLGFDLITDVKAGENRGRKLEHDFVALDFSSTTASRTGESFAATLTLNSKPSAALKRLAVAAWVTPAKSLSPLQTVGGWLSSTNGVPSATPAVGQK